MIARMGVLVKVVDPIRIEKRCPALDPVDLIALAEEKFGQIRTILAGDAGNECNFVHELYLT